VIRGLEDHHPSLSGMLALPAGVTGTGLCRMALRSYRHVSDRLHVERRHCRDWNPVASPYSPANVGEPQASRPAVLAARDASP